MINSNTAHHEALRNENLENQDLIANLRSFVGEGAHYLPCAGNLGDGLIALGTMQLFANLGLAIPIVSRLSPSALECVDRVIVGGGGGWVEGAWEHYANMLQPFLERGGQALVLPSTVLGFGSFFARFGQQIVFFARESATAQRLKATPAMSGRVFAAHDLAFNVDLATLDLPAMEAQHRTLKILRGDAESLASAVEPAAPDLPSMWNGLQWSSEELCRGPLRAVASIMLQFERLETDRLHMAVLGAMLGRQVVLRANSYFKNQAVFEASLQRFPNVTFEASCTRAAAPDWPNGSGDLHLQLAGQHREIQELRARVLHYAARLDCIADFASAVEPAPVDAELQAFLTSRGFRLWRWYLGLYDVPGLGPLLGGARRLVGSARRVGKVGT